MLQESGSGGGSRGGRLVPTIGFAETEIDEPKTQYETKSIIYLSLREYTNNKYCDIYKVNININVFSLIYLKYIKLVLIIL